MVKGGIVGGLGNHSKEQNPNPYWQFLLALWIVTSNIPTQI